MARSWVGLTILACLPCMGTLRSTETRYSYANYGKKKNAMSVRPCQAKSSVTPASRLHCTTKRDLRMSVEHGMHVHASPCCGRLFTDVHACNAMNKTSVDLIWLAS